MSAHAKLSPSGASRWMNCPGSIEASKQYPSTSSIYADEGTFAHELASESLIYEWPAAHMIGVRSPCGRFTVDAEMAKHVQTYLDVVDNLANGADWRYVEHRVTLFRDLWGTADAVIVGGDTWHVVDLKYGQGVLVDVEDNPQLMIYALAALKTLKRDHGVPKDIWVHIVQPRHPQGGHTSQRWPVKKLLRWKADVLIPAVRAARRGTKRLAAGHWCKFCPAGPSCPEIHRAAMQTAASVFSDVPPEVRGPVRPEDLTPDQLGQILALLPTVEEWIKHLRANALDRMLGGQPVPGMKLVKTSPHRRWADPDEALETLAKIVDRKDIMTPSTLKSPAQIEKLLGADAKVVLSSLVETPEGRLTLAPESDRRKAATTLPTFEPINTQESNGET